MTKQEILEYFKDINHAYNESTRLDDLSHMLDELMQSNSDYPKCNTCIHKNEDVICYGCVDNDEYVSNSDEDCISRTEAIKALEYDLSIEADGGLDKYRTVIKDLLNAIYNTQKKAIEDLPSVQPKQKKPLYKIDTAGHIEEVNRIKEFYNKGWKDGAEATAYHVELCEEENPTIPLSVIEDIKKERYNQGFVDGYKNSYDRGHAVIEDIKAEIASCRGKFYRNEDNTYSPYMDGTLDRVLEIIDRHIIGKESK